MNLNVIDLGATGVRVPTFALGCAPMGGLFKAATDEQAVELVRTAVASGVNFFDVAPLYGSGEAERRLGLGLKELPRSNFVVSTKVGRLFTNGAPDPAWIGGSQHAPYFDFSRDGVLSSFHSSLERLGIEYLDVALVHDPDDEFLGQALSEAFPVLQELREQGLVRAIGVGTNRSGTAAHILRQTKIDVVLLAGRVTLLDASGLVDVVAQAAAARVPVLCGGVFNSGILASESGDGNFDYVPAEPQILKRTDHIRRILRNHDVPLARAAIQFPLRYPGVAGVVVGAHDARELSDDLSAFEAPVSPEAWRDLEDAGLVPRP